MLELFDYIATIRDLLPPEICQHIIDEYATDPSVKRALVAGNVEHPARTCSQLMLSQERLYHLSDRRKMIEAALQTACTHMAKSYMRKFPDCHLLGSTGHVYVKYEEGQFYKEHCDNFQDTPRLVTMSIALNDDYEGGEWTWFNGEVKEKLETGTAVMFPSNFMFPHAIPPVTKGTRHAVITWFRG